MDHNARVLLMIWIHAIVTFAMLGYVIVAVVTN